MNDETADTKQPTKFEQLAALITDPSFDQLSEAEQSALTEDLLWWHELHQSHERIKQRDEERQFESDKAFAGEHFARWARRQRQRPKSADGK